MKLSNKFQKQIKNQNKKAQPLCLNPLGQYYPQRTAS